MNIKDLIGKKITGVRIAADPDTGTGHVVTLEVADEALYVDNEYYIYTPDCDDAVLERACVPPVAMCAEIKEATIVSFETSRGWDTFVTIIPMDLAPNLFSFKWWCPSRQDCIVIEEA